MLRKSPLLVLLLAAASLLAVTGCRGVGASGQAAGSVTPSPSTPEETAQPTQVVTSTIPALPSPEATQLVESTIPAQASPTPTATLVVVSQPDATATPTSTASATATAAAQPPATRAAPAVLVTSEPHVDVWTYGTGVVSAQIQGPLQTTIAFLNALIVDGSGNGSLPYLNEALHAEALAASADGLVLGIRTAYVAFEVHWLGSSGGGSQVEAVLAYDSGEQAAHLVELRRSGDAWQITKVSPR